MTRIQKTKKLRSVLTKKDNFSEELFARLWKNKLTIDEIAQFFGVSDETVRIAAKKLEFKSKRAIKRERAQRCQESDPTPEQIRERAAEIRAGWSEHELRIRRVEREVSVSWTPPAFVYKPRQSMFIGT